MRSLLLLVAICCLAISASCSPIARSEESELKEVGRQAAAPAAQAPASSDEDDDDDEDDEDDIGDLAGDDDDDDDEDDDDEDEADDDEEDDYLERFFDDILGGGEDDDDDDEPAAAQPVVAAVDTVAAAPAPAAAPASVEEAAAASEEAEAAEGEVSPEGDEPEAGQKEPASAEVETPAASSEVAAAAEADDDDDDEEEITDAFEPEDDEEDDDEEEEDDDDDEDDDISDALGRNISAKHSRALSEEPLKKPTPVPAAYIVKYNKFVDNILEKMNDILRRSYDPVSVKLQPIDASKSGSKGKKNKNKTNKKKSTNKKKNSARGGMTANKSENETVQKLEEIQQNKIDGFENEEKFNTLSENSQTEMRAVKDKSGVVNGKAKPTTPKPKPTKATKPKPKPPAKAPVKNTKKPAKNKLKSGEKSKPRARGTLYGLSSLRRSGDVAVSIMTNHTTIKCNFAVGPLILRVEKEVGRGAKKELKSATATTAEMNGKLTLRVNNQGVATLHSIKVLQPKQVRVDSNHERTRELVWQRSARIAHVVSEKLRSASKPMFLHQSVVRQ